MTIQELLTKEPHLTTDEKKTGIYLIPSDKFGFTSFPVGSVDAEGKFVADRSAVLVSADDYVQLLEHKKCWTGGRLVAYVKSTAVSDAEALLEAANTKQADAEAAQAWLNDHDYIGVKISEAVLLNDTKELEGLRTKYGAVIAEAKLKRKIVDENLKWIESNSEAVKKAQEVLWHEN